MNLWHPIDPNYNGLIFHVEHDPSLQELNLRIVQQEVSKRTVGELIFHEKTPGSYYPPTISISDYRPDLQHLFNALWDFGYRPPVERNVNDVIAAKDAHLDDLRRYLNKEMGL